MRRFQFSVVFTIALAFLVIQASVAVNPDDLDIRLNRSLWESSLKGASYGTTIHIDGLSDWEDKHIVDLAFAAHARFEDQYERDTNRDSETYIPGLKKSRYKSTVTTTMVVDNTAYIATSLKARGGSYLYDVAGNDIKDHMAGKKIPESHPCNGNAVVDGLRRCQAMAVETDRGQKNMGNCGEYMATLAFCITSNRRDLENARIVTVSTNSKTGVDEIKGPCDNDLVDGKEPQWGCTAFAMEVEIRVLDESAGREEKEVSSEQIRAGTLAQVVYP